MRRAAVVVSWVCLFSAVTVWAQFPNPFPRRGGQGKQTPSDRKTSNKKEPEHFTGIVRTRAAESISVELADTRIIDFVCAKDTKYVRNGEPIQSADLKAGDEVAVDALQDNEGFFHAVTFNLKKAAPAPVAPAAPAPKSEEPPTTPEAPSTVLTPPPAAPDPDDPGPPALRRGKQATRAPGRSTVPAAEPAAVAGNSSAPAEQPAAVADAPVISKEDPFLDKAREIALEFTETLPNYLCKQMTTRYQSERRPSDWRPLDVVSAAVVYEDGRESYRDVRINDKPQKKEMDAIPGSRSRGEFGSTMRDLFSPATAAAFRFRRESSAAGLVAAVYDFQVEHANSHWQNQAGGQTVFPAYKGSVWIDRKSFRVLRIEMQARTIPEQFPLDTSEWVVDYEFVRIGPNPYLVPVHAENLACFRGTTRCVRNATDFRNYRRFTGESQIMTVDSSVDFEAEEAKPKPAAKKDEKKR